MILITPSSVDSSGHISTYLMLFKAYQSTFEGDPYNDPSFTWDGIHKSHVVSSIAEMELETGLTSRKAWKPLNHPSLG